MKTKSIILIVVFAVLVLGIGLFIRQHMISTQSVSKHSIHHDIWYCPMHPHYTSDRSGKCPICGMDLVKRIEASLQHKSTIEGYTTISVTPQKQQLIGVRTAIVTKKSAGETIIVPREAVMDTGVRKIVFVQKDAGTFEPRDIQTGLETDDGFEVKSGLKTGDRIVISGNFLLDSESRMQAALEQGGNNG